MSNDLQMVKRKYKRLTSQNSGEPNNRSRGSIKKYCTQKKIHKQKNLHSKMRKNDYLRNNKIQNSICSTPNILNKKKIEKSLSNIQNDITLYEIKPISPTKLSISVKKFYNNDNFKQYDENLQLLDKKNIYPKERIIIDKHKNKGDQHLSNNLEHNDTNNTYHKTKRKYKKNNLHKSYDLNPQLNKNCKKKVDSVKVYHNDCNFENDLTQQHSVQSENIITNETQTNEYLVEEYQVTQSTNNALSISVKRFYKSKVTSNTNENENVKKDMPLISDTTFNSKADFNQSSPSSKLNNSHKISLNVKHINDTTNDKQQKVTAFFPIRRSARKTKHTVNEEKQKALEKSIASQNEDGLKVAVFPNKGRGVIAGRNFERGEYVVEYSGDLISLEEARKREAIYAQDTSTGCYMYYFKYGSTHYCIDATIESSRLGRLVNHSRFGNLGPKVVEISGFPRIVLTAKTEIKQGEELTYDYGDRSKTSLINHPWLAY